MAEESNALNNAQGLQNANRPRHYTAAKPDIRHDYDEEIPGEKI